MIGWFRRLHLRLWHNAFHAGLRIGMEAEHARACAILSIAERHRLLDLAGAAIAAGISPDEFQRAVACIAQHNLSATRWRAVPALRAEFNEQSEFYQQTQMKEQQKWQ